MIRVITTGKNLSKEGIPNLFIPIVDDFLQTQPEAVVAAIALDTRDREEWRRLSKSILHELSSDGYFVGVLLEGVFEPAVLLKFFGTMFSQDQRGYWCNSRVNLYWALRPDSIRPRKSTSNTFWFSWTPTFYTSWLFDIFDAPSELTFNGCNLMICFSEEQKAVTNASPDVDTFKMIVRNAMSWIIPIDGYIGCHIGLNMNGKSHEKILKGALII